MLAPRPTAGPALALLQFLLGSADPPLTSLDLLGILDPADEFVPRQRRDVFPRRQRRGVVLQRCAQVGRQRVDYPARNLLVHSATLLPMIRTAK